MTDSLLTETISEGKVDDTLQNPGKIIQLWEQTEPVA